MQKDLKKIGARIYFNDNDMLIQKVTYVYADGTESGPLSQFIHLGMFTDSILFGEECQIRFFVYPDSIRLYDMDVDILEFINDSNNTVTIFCFGQQIILAPQKTEKLMNNSTKKSIHTTKPTVENK